MSGFLRCSGALVGALGLVSSAQGQENDTSGSAKAAGTQPEVTAAVHYDASPPLKFLPAVSPAPPRVHYEPGPLPRPTRLKPLPADPALQTTGPIALAPVPHLNLDGVGAGFSGPAGTFFVNSAPPDPNGDVGPNHYVQVVNTDFAVFNKVGTALFGPVPINTLWSGFGGKCQADNDGDPIVLYDGIADRWIISQFAVTGADGAATPFLECVAVSQTPDPTGAYYRYAFPYTGFNDYPKIGVWPDAYYVTFNMFDPTGTLFTGGKACAYDRAKMLLGQPATQQCFNTSAAQGGLLPADLDGARLPPAGAPNTVVALDGTAVDQLAVWQFHTDWNTPANSTFTGPTTLPTAPFSEPCGGFRQCIPQSGGGLLDSLGDRLMHRLAYRNFADGHQSLVVNHSITVGSSTGVRWYELRFVAGAISLFQQGTYAPDASYRWMGSIAQDQDGNMALGFSVSSSTIKPQIHFTGRLAGDPVGQMTQGEGVIIDGAGAQGSSLSRWGDYSMMAVDPADDCTFWYTNQYIPADGIFNWRTRIGAFFFPGCGNATPVITLKVNGQHPTPPVVTVSGPTLLTLDVSSSTFSTAVDWYWALSYNGNLFWVTSAGVSRTPAPWFHAPPAALTNVTLLNVTLPPASTFTNYVFMVNGTSLLGFDFITATRP